MENILYNQLANFYDKIANDREFTSECRDIVNYYIEHTGRKPNNLLELFAGPAYHSEILQNNYGMKCFAIDSSEQMKKIACEDHSINSEDYFVGTLPHILNHFYLQMQFDLVLVMRYSIGLISYDDAEELLNRLANMLAPGAIIFIELHNINSLFNQFNELQIKHRQKYLAETGQTISCLWPSGPLHWAKDAWQVTMPIEVEITEPNGHKRILKSISEETIFTISDIDRMIKKTNLTRIDAPSICSERASNLVILQRN